MSTKKKYLVKSLVVDSETRELWNEPYDEFGVSFPDTTIIYVKEEYGSAEGKDMPIDEFISDILKVKEAGATHIAVGWHCDHECYELSGYTVKEATAAEISEKLDREKKAKALVNREEIKRLEKRLEELKKESTDLT